MNILSALTKNPLKNVICGSRSTVKSTTNHFSLPSVHKIIRALIGHVRVCVLEEGLYKEVSDFFRLCIFKF